MNLSETVTGSKRIYEGKIVNLRVDDVQLANGGTSKREVVEHGGAVAVVAMPDPDTVILVRQFRLPAEGALLEIVAGGLEDGESPEVSARRELTEEIGYTCADLIPLYEAWVAPGYTTEKIYGYLALGLTEEVGLPPDQAACGQIRRVRLHEADEWQEKQLAVESGTR